MACPMPISGFLLILRCAMYLVNAAVVLEGVKLFFLPRPQPERGAVVALLGTVGVALQLYLRDTPGQAPPPVACLRGARSVELRFVAAGLLAVLECQMLMGSKGSGGIYMTWVTFASACAMLLVFAVYLLRIDSLIARCTNHAAFRWPTPVQMGLSKGRVAAFGSTSGFFLVWVFASLLQWDDVAKHDSRWNAIRSTLTTDGKDAFERARAYWEIQKPLIQESLKTNFTLHPYFARTELWEGARWDEVINMRIESMGKQLDNGKKGFMIEKDKCAMFEFFMEHEIPIPPVLTILRGSKDEVEAKLRDVHTHPSAYQFPLFLKGCHLTQGSDKGMRALTPKKLEKGSFEKDVIPWMKKKWDQRPNDSGRAWAEVMNRLLDTLPPGFAIQGPFRGMRVSPYNTPLEVKVEVLWGRAYLGLFADFHDIIALRDGSLEFTCRDKACSQWWSHGNVPDLRLKWAVENGHMEAVWTLAERVAQAIGIDEARIDIFIDPNRPKEPVVNEISLSSGHEYMYHTDFLAEAWAAPHLSMAGHQRYHGWPKPIVRQTDVDVHLQKKPPLGGRGLAAVL